MYFYKTFGINIQSDVLIPQFPTSGERRIDARIRFGDVQNLLPDNEKHERALQLSKTEICFYWEKIGWFLVRNGNEIIVDPDADAEDKLVSLPLIGIVLAALLQQRGMLALHASAVSIGGGAVAFMGWKGAGKSTTAAMLYGRGHKMISDDIVAVKNSDGGGVTVVPGFPTFKLMPETALTVLGDNPNNLPQVYSGAEKLFRSFGDNFLTDNVPLRAIYVLEDGANLQTTLLNSQEAVKTLIANTFLARYGKQLLQNSHAAANLLQCSNIVNRIPIYRLGRPKSMPLLGELAKLIESQCEDVKVAF